MPIPAALKRNLTLPVIGAPMFIVSTPELVIAQCKAGIIGAFPALNARPAEKLDTWLTTIEAALADQPAAPYAVNLIVHPTNERLAADLACCVAHRVPLVITSLGAPSAIVPQVHAYGGLVFHDVTNVRHAIKALEAGVDGLILVAAGAGGHGGTLSPFALVAEVRRFYDGPLALAGAITQGRQILAAQVLGADFAYLGTRFIATQEANASDAYKQAILAAHAEDIVYTPYFTGVPGNYLKSSILAAGLDPAALPSGHGPKLEFTRASEGAKAWRDIWGAGQGVGGIEDVPHTAVLVERLKREFDAARAASCGL
ncbi:NAD(P)H-dependent flavin oxidoreductase [Sulfuricystis multivorans]|uniref:NAD(P)H-dependent flavin oxidoreductase n=1 Tax=Sulfuricystis multivorans TaxID=2211108 RepID=UPI000F82D28C|nr:nitronate monooxygenase family protein [Sulfuricystis multivorans]